MKSFQKRILFSAYAFYPEFGGLEQQVYLLSQEYIKLGFQVDVLTEKTRPELSSHEIIDGISVFRMPYHAQRNAFSYVSLLYHLSSFIVKNAARYDFIILRAALTLYPLVFGFWKFMRVIKAPTYVTADTGGDMDEIIIVKRWPLHKVMLRLFDQHNWLNSVCKANYKHYLELGFAPGKLTQIPNGVDIHTHRAVRYANNVTNFLFIGRFIKEKGIHELLEAFKNLYRRFPTSKLFMAGDGPERQYIETYVKNHKLHDAVKLYGAVSGEKKEKFFSQGECLILPSYSEGFGLVITEAAVRKKYIISTDVADLKETYGKNILFCSKRDPVDLQNKMELVLNSRKLPKLEYDRIIPKFDIALVAKQILALLLKS